MDGEVDSRATVTHAGILDMQVCVPGEWTDEQVIDFAESQYPCGTSSGWGIRKQGDPSLAGQNERVKCQGGPEGNVHIMLDA